LEPHSWGIGEDVVGKMLWGRCGRLVNSGQKRGVHYGYGFIAHDSSRRLRGHQEDEDEIAGHLAEDEEVVAEAECDTLMNGFMDGSMDLWMAETIG
jgi:hypothetical protein